MGHLEALEARTLLSLTPVMDRLPGTGPSSPQLLTDVNGILLFMTASPVKGLWKTDGTGAGTVLLYDFTSLAGAPTSIVAVGNVGYFTATDASGLELWKTDGVTTGRVADINPGSASSSPGNLTAVGSTLYFTANDGTHGIELWKADTSGVSMVRDILGDAANSSSPANLTVVGSTLYFSANDGSHGIELWKADGSGASLVKDLNVTAAPTPGTTKSSSPGNLTNVNGTLYFSADDGGGVQLFSTDGTAGNTIKLTTTLTSISSLTSVASTLYFVGREAAHGRELWKSDGSVGGTSLLKDIFAGPGDSLPANLTNVNGIAYFTANDATHGVELWRSDGTTLGTQLVADLNVGAANSQPSGLIAINGKLFFIASDAAGIKAWATDGTTTVSLTSSPLLAAPGMTAAAGGLYVFSITDLTGTHLWSTDGTPSAAAFATPVSFASPITVRTTSGGSLYLVADDGLLGSELWKTDGTPAGTGLVKDIATSAPSGAPSGNPNAVATFNGSLYFVASSGGLYKSDGIPGDTAIKISNKTPALFAVAANTLYFTVADSKLPALWKTDGTTAGTVLVRGFPLSDATSSLTNLTAFNGAVYFCWFSNGEGGAVELWRSDGTAAGTTRAQDPAVALRGLSPQLLTVSGNYLFFYANDGTHGWEIWKTDGTSNGTGLVADVNPGSGSSVNTFNNVVQSTLIDAGGTLIFPVFVGPGGGSVFRSDGTSQGTYAITGGTNSFEGMVGVNGTVFYISYSSLWKTNGQAAGTVKLADLLLGSPVGTYRVGNSVYIVTKLNTYAYYLWVSDGTVPGTTLLKTFTTDGTSVAPGVGPIFDFNGTAVFPAWNAADGAGVELWLSNGTPAGTGPAGSINPGSASSNPANFVSFNNALYFTAQDAVSGTRLWKALLPTVPPPAPVAFNGVAISPFEVDLSWQDASGQAMNYRVERSNDPTFTTVDGAFLLGSGINTYKDMLALPASRTYYRLTAYNVAGGATPVVTSAVTPAATYPPGLTLLTSAEWKLPSGPVNFRQQTFFNAYSSTRGWAFVRSDGVTLTPLLIGATAGQLMVVGNIMFFQMNGTALWKSDGTPEGTVQLVQWYNQGVAPIDKLTVVNGRLYFRNGDGSALYTSDGTPQGTVPATIGTDPLSKVLQSAILAGAIPDYAVGGNRVFYAAAGQPRVVDTTTGVDIALAPPSGSTVNSFVNAYGTVYFLAGPFLWKTDGTPLGTIQVASIPGYSSNVHVKPAGLVAVNGTLFFSNGPSLWASDGTPAGTTKIFESGDATSYSVSSVTVFAGRVYFTSNVPTADGSSTLATLWTSDGTAQGTALVPGQGVGDSVGGNLAIVGATAFLGGQIGGASGLVTLTPSPLALTAPAAPTGLTATAFSAGEVDLNWSDNSSNEEGYRIDRSTGPDFGTLVSVVVVPNSTWYVDTTVAPGTTYYYRISAFNDGGASTLVPAAMPATTPSGPLAPTGLVLTNAIPGEAVDLSWTDQATDASGYVVQRSSTPSFYPANTIDVTVSLLANATGYRDATVDRLTGYYYRVFAVKDTSYSAAAAGFVATSDYRPKTPTNLQTAGVSANEIDLQWQDNADNESAVAGYRVERAGNDGNFVQIAQLPADTTNYIDLGLPVGSLLTYRVRAINSVGSSDYAIGLPTETLPPSLSTQVVQLPAVMSNTSPTSSDPLPVVTMNGVGYFLAADYSSGQRRMQLWRTDGTAVGTSEITDFGQVSVTNLVASGSCFYFTVATGYSVALWRTDGTSAGTLSLGVLYTGAPEVPQQSIGGSIAFNGKIYLTVLQPSAGGVSLWRSDGTPAGTALQQTWSTGGGASQFMVWNNNLYFRISGTEYKTDGTSSITATTDLPQVFSASEHVVVAGKIYYVAVSGGVYVTDGTPGGDILLNPTGYYLMPVGNKVAFEFGDQVGHSAHVYATDGTPGSVVELGTYRGYSNGVTEMVGVGNTLYYDTANVLYRSDLTAGSGVLISLIPGLPDHFGAVGNLLTFRAGAATQLWASDGTADNTGPITNIGGIPSPAHPDNMVVINGITYFASSGNGGSGELWKTDGTPSGTVRIFVGSVGSPTNWNGTLYFMSGKVLYKSDGTPQGTVKVQDLYTATSASRISICGAYNGNLYLSVVNYAGAAFLWRTDGSPTGAQPFGNFRVGPAILTSGGYLYFVDDTGPYGTGFFWRTDGTVANTIKLVTSVRFSSLVDVNGVIYATSSTGQPTQLWRVNPGDTSATLVMAMTYLGAPTKVGNSLYFTARTVDRGFVVYKTDGTAAGTQEVFDPSTDSSLLSDGGNVWAAVDVNGTAFFLSADSMTSGRPGPTGWLWKTDGTAAGTVKLRPVNVGQWPSYGDAGPLFASAVAGMLVYSDGEHLWRSDGTTAGTVQIDEVGTASDGTHSLSLFGPSPFLVEGDRIFYSAATVGFGRELRVATLTPPAQPSQLVVTAIGSGSSTASAVSGASPLASQSSGGTYLSWVNHSSTETGYVIEASTSPLFSTIDRVLYAPAGSTSYTDSGVPFGQYYYRVSAVNAGGRSASSNVAGVAASVAGRYIFYNNSYWDDTTFGRSDDTAIDTSKSALLPGQTATFANYTGSLQGINGVMVDIANLTGTVTASDFTFRVGNNSTPGGWGLAPAPTSILTRFGQGVGGADRVEFIWADGAIKQQWLQVTVNAGGNTGLASADVFYFGNAMGETGNSLDDTFVDASDMVAVRDSVTPSGSHALPSNRFDLNHDGFVDASDMVVVRDHVVDPANLLRLISPPVPAALAISAATGSSGTVAVASPVAKLAASGDGATVPSLPASVGGKVSTSPAPAAQLPPPKPMILSKPVRPVAKAPVHKPAQPPTTVLPVAGKRNSPSKYIPASPSTPAFGLVRIVPSLPAPSAGFDDLLSKVRNGSVLGKSLAPRRAVVN